MSGPRDEHRSRAYDLLLRAYPRRYRDRFGRAMRETFLADHARVRATGRVALAPFWISTMLQAVWFGTGERVRALRAGAPINGSASARSAIPPGRRRRWTVGADLRYAVRLLRRSPVFTLTAVLSLAIGIAASTVMFGAADALFFQGSPGVRDAWQVVDIARSTNGGGDGPLAYVVFRHLREHTRTVESMAATTRSPMPLSLSDGASAERVYGRTVSGTYFDVLKMRPALGRFFRADEDAVVGARPVAVLSYRFWQERLHADPGVLTRPVRLNGIPFDVIGVAEAGFDGTTIIGTDLWVPMAMASTLRGTRDAAPVSKPGSESDVGPEWDDVRAIGRLAPGVTREVAQAELNALLTALKAETPSIPASHGIAVDPCGPLPPRARPQFAAFVGLISLLAGGLLAIACSNVAGMLLARATIRRHEMATRLAVGASRGRLIGQMLVETLVLFVAAGVVAVPLAFWLAGALHAFLPSTLVVPIVFEVPITLRSALFAVTLALATGVLFGLAPARLALRSDVSQMLHGRSSTASRERARLRHVLVVAQVALSLALVITAGLFVRTLRAAADIDIGFKTANVTVIALDTTVVDATGPRAIPLITRITERLRTIGGVEVVGQGAVVPLEGNSISLGGIRLPDPKAADMTQLARLDWEVVSPDYFRAVGMPIVSGRAFTTDDRDGRPRVAIVNEAFARAAWPGQSPIGQRFWQTSGERHQTEQPLEVVGVARDAKYRYVDEVSRVMVYVPFEQQPRARVELFVKHAADQSLVKDLHAAISSVEPRLPVVLLRSFDAATAVGMLPQRFAAWVAGSVGVIGIFLAALGLYGLAAFLVAQRTREIAIRMALGASREQVRSMVLGQAARLGVAGAGAGLGLAWALGRLVQRASLLVGVHPTDPVTFVSLAIAMGAVLFVASYVPARRAAATDPAEALRTQ